MSSLNWEHWIIIRHFKPVTSGGHSSNILPRAGSVVGSNHGGGHSSWGLETLQEGRWQHLPGSRTTAQLFWGENLFLISRFFGHQDPGHSHQHHCWCFSCLGQGCTSLLPQVHRGPGGPILLLIPVPLGGTSGLERLFHYHQHWCQLESITPSSNPW